MKPNKSFARIAIVVLIIGFRQISVKGESPTPSPKTPAVIVIRHGLDRSEATSSTSNIASAWMDTCTNWPIYPIFSWSTNVEGKYLQLATITTPNHRLTNSGDLSAVRLADTLPTFLESQNIAPVNTVYAVDPRTSANTPNPFDTAWPFIFKNINTVKVILHPKSEWAINTNNYNYFLNNKDKVLDNLGLIKNGQLTKVGTNSKIIFATQDDIGKKAKENQPQADEYIINYFTQPANAETNKLIKSIWKSWINNKSILAHKVGDRDGSEIFIFTKDTSNGPVSMEVWKFYSSNAQFHPFEKYVGLTNATDGKLYIHLYPTDQTNGEIHWLPKNSQ